MFVIRRDNADSIISRYSGRTIPATHGMHVVNPTIEFSMQTLYFNTENVQINALEYTCNELRSDGVVPQDGYGFPAVLEGGAYRNSSLGTDVPD